MGRFPACHPWPCALPSTGVVSALPPSHAGLAMIHDSILGTIGRTPVVRLNRVAPATVELYAKVEAFNPGGSVKDRLATAIIDRKSVVEGKSVSVSVDLGGRRIIKTKTTQIDNVIIATHKKH